MNRAFFRKPFAFAHKAYFYLRWEAFRQSPFCVHYCGYQLVYERGNKAVADLSFGYPYERREIALALRELPRDAVVFDVGANIGLITLAIARGAPTAQIHCFEPSVHALRVLEQTVQRNDLAGRINVNAMALGALTGEMSFTLHGANNSTGDGFRDTGRAGPGVNVKVPVTTLDAYVQAKKLERLDLIKIDTEGAELLVLQGGRHTLQTFRPKIILEVFPLNLQAYDITTEQIHKFLKELGYQIRTVRGEIVENVEFFAQRAALDANMLAVSSA